jgi:hypothetical protein
MECSVDGEQPNFAVESLRRWSDRLSQARPTGSSQGGPHRTLTLPAAKFPFLNLLRIHFLSGSLSTKFIRSGAQMAASGGGIR